VPGRVDAWVVVANLTDTLTSNGWQHLDIASNESKDDKDQAEAAGVAEGYLTRNLILSYYREFIHKDFCSVERKFCDFTISNMKENEAWIEEKLKSSEGKTDYWKTVKLFYLQLNGLKKGWQLRTEDDNLETPSDFDVEWFTHFINFYPDIGDYITNYKKVRGKKPRQLKSFTPSCSVLIKKLEGNDVLVGHATWHEYRAMSYRLLKRYNLNYHSKKNIIPGHTISMTSYAGNIFSLDDYYSISSGLATLETTLFIYNKALYETNQPTGVLWESVRVMVANRLATDGKEWVEIFRQHNSGTYNNQWMVIDYNLVRDGAKAGLLWVLEQIPGSTVSKDMTQHLLNNSYWASYNRAYFLDTFIQTGAQEMSRLYGDWFSYDRTPRAKLFRENHASVKNAGSMMKLLRMNSYVSSIHNTPQGCTGPIPSASIASRSDLQSPTVSCSWEKEDYMVGRRAYGAIDAKVMSSQSAETLGFDVVAGPTTSKGSLPPFSWTSSEFKAPDFLPIRTFDFDSLSLVWNGGYTSRGVFEEGSESTEPSVNNGGSEGPEQSINNGGFKFKDLINSFVMVLIYL